MVDAHDSTVRPGPRVRRGLGTAVLTLLVVLTTTWGLGADRTGAGDGDVAVDGGVLRLDAVRGELLQHDLMPMPAGMMPDAVPDGHVRIWLDLTLAATESTTSWAPEDFTLRGPRGLAAPVRRTSVEPVVVPAGSAATFALQFEVPAGIEDLELHVEGARRTLPLTVDPQDQHVHDH